MKILHCADIHLGSRLKSKFTPEKSKERKSEILSTFNNLIDYAVKNNINVIMLSGDVFDQDKPSSKDKEFFYSVVKNNPQIDFLYLKGNHDKEDTFSETDIPNLKSFNKDNITSYEYDNVCISGIELCESNCIKFYSQFNLDKNKTNIVMLHGQISDIKDANNIKISELKNKNIDYLALGHIHSYSASDLDDRGVYVYSGCLEGRGFDECGDKGFVEITIENGKLSHQFIKLAKRTIHNVEVNVTGLDSLYKITARTKSIVKDIPTLDILNILLTGEIIAGVEFSELDIKSSLSEYFYVNVKNNVSIKINQNDYKDDKSLLGEFVRSVSDNTEYTDEQKQTIINIGIKAINGKEIN